MNRAGWYADQLYFLYSGNETLIRNNMHVVPWDHIFDSYFHQLFLTTNNENTIMSYAGIGGEKILW